MYNVSLTQIASIDCDRTKSNQIRYLLVNATTRRDADNNIVGVVGVAQDVTEAAKHDRGLAAMANELRQLVDTANAPIFGKYTLIETLTCWFIPPVNLATIFGCVRFLIFELPPLL